jgi:hypothetical protein
MWPGGTICTASRLLDEVVVDCETILHSSAPGFENTAALFVRANAGQLRSTEEFSSGTLLADQLRELRYAKGLLWKLTQLGAGDEEHSVLCAKVGVALSAKETEAIEAAKASPSAIPSSIKVFNKFSDGGLAVDVHWVKAEGETRCLEKNIEPGFSRGIRSKVGDRFMVFEHGFTNNALGTPTSRTVQTGSQAVH